TILQALPSPSRAAFMAGASVPTVVASGNAVFNRQQDQTNSAKLSFGGGPARTNNYILDGVPITDIANRAVASPSLDANHDVLAQNISTTFPTAAERLGDFSSLTNSSGAKVTIYDPLTHLPFPGNIIPANRINPVAAAIARYFPLPQSNIDNGSANYTATA